ncbi:hypothetical protein [Mesorhizobium sp.]|uniref:hypothetical protein n=1 Tax=Mesorhizobium sp. TaxID=1871066 RepID=UPI000FEA5D1E|nr:hypothetical protein [Mesorhizobium sp.]RWO22121.1 MAG: hypothetical protein EOS09_20985 [Mesorhizobium sp.]
MVEELALPDMSEEQRHTASLLQRLLGKRTADRYVDFCRLAAGTLPLRVSVPLAGHAMREIDAILRQLLATPADLTVAISPEAQNRLEQAGAALQALGYLQQAADRAVATLAPKLSHREQIERICATLGLAPDGDVARSWKSVMAAHAKAHYGRELHQSLEVDAQFRSEWQVPFDTTVRGLMVALQGKYSAYIRRLDEVLAMPDRRTAVQALSREIPGALPLLSYFFERLESADWLDPLTENRLLAASWAGLDDIDDGLRLQHWPAGRYLVRMAASSDPAVRAKVAAALRAVSWSEDQDVHWHGVEAIAALPAGEAKGLIDIVEGWLGHDTRLPISSAVHTILENLVTAGRHEAALGLFGSLYRIVPDDGRATTLFGQHMFEHFLPQDVRACAAGLGSDLVRVLCQMLDTALRIERRVSDDPPGDYSHHMSRTISEQGPKHGIVDALVGEIVRSARLISSAQPYRLEAVVAEISRYPSRLFTRLRLHVLSLDPASAPTLATASLDDAGLIGETWCSVEYGELAAARFEHLPVEIQNRILSAVDKVPSKHEPSWLERFKKSTGRDPNEEERTRFRTSVLRDVQWHWRQVLPKDRQKEVERLGDPDAWLKQLHEPDISPAGATDLATRSIDEIVSFVTDWRPSPQAQKETVTALGQQLRHAAEQNAAAFSEDAAKFSSVPAIYSRRIIEGLTTVVRNKNAVNWQGILALTGALVSRAGPTGDEGEGEGHDSDWSWARKAAMELISLGLLLGKEGIGFGLEGEVRAQVLSFYESSSATDTESFEENYRRQVYFAATSTSRGAALELCIQLIFWLSKNSETAVGKDPGNALAALPKIKSFLDAEVARSGADGRIPRAIIGRYLGWLSYFAAEFVESNVDNFFQTSDAHLRDAVWLSHVQMGSGPLSWLATEMSDCYRHEIQRLAEDVPGADRAHLTEKFTHYLVLLYIVDALPEELYAQFWNDAPIEARQMAMLFLGTQLALPEGALSTESRLRAQSYWDRRLLAASHPSAQRTAFQKEIGAIGQFFYQRGLDPDWLMQQTIAASNAGYGPGQTFHLVDRIAEFSALLPHRAVETISTLIKNRHVEMMELGVRSQNLRAIFVAGLSTGDTRAVANVVDAINFLVAAGDTSCLDLLPKEPETVAARQ